MNIEDEIVAAFSRPDGVWFVEEGKRMEAIMLKDAVDRITDLKDQLEDAEAQVADWDDHFDEHVKEAKAEMNGRRDQFVAAFDKVVRATNCFIEISDNFLNSKTEEKNGQQ